MFFAIASIFIDCYSANPRLCAPGRDAPRTPAYRPPARRCAPRGLRGTRAPGRPGPGAPRLQSRPAPPRAGQRPLGLRPPRPSPAVTGVSPEKSRARAVSRRSRVQPRRRPHLRPHSGLYLCGPRSHPSQGTGRGGGGGRDRRCRPRRPDTQARGLRFGLRRGLGRTPSRSRIALRRSGRERGPGTRPRREGRVRSTSAKGGASGWAPPPPRLPALAPPPPAAPRDRRSLPRAWQPLGSPRGQWAAPCPQLEL